MVSVYYLLCTKGDRAAAYRLLLDAAQALCEFSKYVRYIADGVSGVGCFNPTISEGAGIWKMQKMAKAVQ